MRRPTTALGASVLACLIMAVPGAALAGGKHHGHKHGHHHGHHHGHKSDPMTCGDLAAWVLDDDHKVLEATSEIVPAAGNSPSYCVVNLKRYHAVNIRVGLPLNSVDGGTGGVEGAWNGKIQNTGGGGFAGSVGNVAGQVSAGYVGSSTDTGHSTAWCNEINPETGQPNSVPNCGAGGAGHMVTPDYELIKYQITDFIKDSLYHQVTKAIDLSKAYYGEKHKRNYWNGCSTGGRQGMEMAMSHGELFDGILAGSPAINWNRFYIGEQLWGYVTVKEHLGEGASLSQQKYNATNAAAIAACDADDGVTDGVVNEPRRCDYDAAERLCSVIPGESTCLSEEEAAAINQMWDGPRDSKGRRLWGGLPIGAPANIYAPGTRALGRHSFWVRFDPDWFGQDLTVDNYEAEFTLTNDMYQGWASSDDPDLDKLKKHGGKILHYHGLADPLITAVGSWEYSSRVIDRYGAKKSQEFMRSFFYPAGGHCGGAGMNGGQLFDLLVDWVENDVEPDHVVISPGGGRTTKICMYPNETVYNGSGDVNDEANYHCAVNKKEPGDLREWADFAPRKGDPGKGRGHRGGKGHDHGKGHGNDHGKGHGKGHDHGKKKGHGHH